MTVRPALRVIVELPDPEVGRGLAGHVQVVDQPPADVALLVLAGDVDGAAIDAVVALRRRSDAPVVALVDGPLSPRRARELAARAGGVVERARLEEALEPTLRAVAAGQAVYPAAQQRALERPPLSNREKQVLAMVVLGCSNAEIAAKLVVSESTVKNHLSSAFSKLGVRSRAAAAKLILDPETGLGLGVLRLSDTSDGGSLTDASG